MYRLDRWRLFLALAVFLIAAGVCRSAWATRRDGFTIDEPWHVTAGVGYLRTGDYYLNPEHPPLVKLVAALAAPRTVFRFAEPISLRDKTEERKFVEETMYAHNDADKIQARVRPVMYLFNGLLLLLFAASVFRVFGGAVALGALLFVLIDPTVAAHWPVVMTDLPSRASFRYLRVGMHRIAPELDMGQCRPVVDRAWTGALGQTFGVDRVRLHGSVRCGGLGVAVSARETREWCGGLAYFWSCLWAPWRSYGVRTIFVIERAVSPPKNSIGRWLQKLGTSAPLFGEAA